MSFGTTRTLHGQPWALVCALVAGLACGQPSGFVGEEPAIAYWELGEGDQALIVLHGGPGVTHDYLRPEWEVLADGRRLVFYDQRGCGRSDRADSYSWRDHMADLHRLVLRVGSDGPVSLAGSSWGAVLAVLYAREHPDRVSALLLTGMPSWSSLERSGRWVVETSMRDSVPRHPLQHPPNPDPYGVDESFRRRLVLCEDALYGTYESLAGLETLERMEPLEVPTLAIYGEDDGLPGVPREALEHALPRARVLVIEQAGHDPWYNRPDRFFAAAEAFLGRNP